MLKHLPEIKPYLDRQRESNRTPLDELVPEKSGLLYQAARYSLLGGGKRLRPIIVMATAEALGGRPESALNPACALEMVHAFSLIHDDLPRWTTTILDGENPPCTKCTRNRTRF